MLVFYLKLAKMHGNKIIYAKVIKIYTWRSLVSSYRTVAIETYSGRETTSSQGVRARPLPGQKLDTSMNVECSSKMRKNYPLGTKFLIEAKVTCKEGGTPFLYSHYNKPYKVISAEEADKFIRGMAL